MFNNFKNNMKSVVQNLSLKDWLLITLSVFMLGFYFYGRYYKNKSIEYYNQRGIWADSVSLYKNKLGEEYASKLTLIMDNKDLKKYNEDLYNEVKNLKDNPLVITKTDLQTVIKEVAAKNDTVYVHDTDTQGVKNYTYEWSVKDSVWYSVKGISEIKSDFSSFKTTIPELKLNTALTLNLIETKENLQVIAKTDNPYVRISDIQSVVIDPKKSKTLKSYFPQKQWGVGPQVGIGLTGDLKFRPYIGLGVQYSIINF